jgi:hypothetical protein
MAHAPALVSPKGRAVLQMSGVESLETWATHLTTEVKMRFLRLVALIILILLTMWCQSTGQEKTLLDSFRGEWKATAVEILENHFESHSDCDLVGATEIIKHMQFFGSMKLHPKTKAKVFPEEGEVFPAVFINVSYRYKWTPSEAVRTEIHEATHFIRRNNKWLCGPDGETDSNYNYLRAVPPCRLFGEIQYNSSQIDEALEKHLRIGEKLKQLAKNE